MLASTSRGGGGCLLPGGGLLPGGLVWRGLLQGGLFPGGFWIRGVVSQHALRQTPPVDRITDACENITLTQLRGIINNRSGSQAAFGQCNIYLNGVFTPSAAETQRHWNWGRDQNMGGVVSWQLNLFHGLCPGSVIQTVLASLFQLNKYDLCFSLCPGLCSSQCKYAITKIVAIVKLGSPISS